MAASPSWFDMSRTDAAGIALLVAVVVFLIVLIKALRD
jgi:hypothetical protein